jgi:hypothetical protein
MLIQRNYMNFNNLNLNLTKIMNLLKVDNLKQTMTKTFQK